MLREYERHPVPSLAAPIALAAQRAKAAIRGEAAADSRAWLMCSTARATALQDLEALLAPRPERTLPMSAHILGSIVDDALSLKGAQGTAAFTSIDIERELPAPQLLRIALILNELVLNALQHAHPAGAPLVLDVWCRDERGGFAMDVRDDGVGLPVERHCEGFGLTFARTLAKELRARLDLTSTALGLSARLWAPA